MNKFNTHNPPCSVTIPDLKMRKIKAQRLNKLPKAMILNKWWSWGLPDSEPSHLTNYPTNDCLSFFEEK